MLVIISNPGNVGLPVALLAFGDAGLAPAVVYVVAWLVVSFTGGLAIASLARGGRGAALTASLRFPLIYAAMLALALNAWDVSVPAAVMNAVDSLGAGAIPVMVVVLGLHVVSGVERGSERDLLIAVLLRLVLAPLIAWPLATAVGLEGVELAAVIVLAGTPAAVTTTMLATLYGAAPRFVSTGVIASTVVSVLSLTVLIDLVG